MPTPPPRHLARPRRPWRLLLFIFGLTTAILAALVASATLIPQPQPPRRVPGVALPTSPPEPAPTAASTTTTRRPGTDDRISPIHHPRPRTGSHQRTGHNHPTGHRPSAGQDRRRDHPHRTPVLWRHHHPAHHNRATDHGQAN